MDDIYEILTKRSVLYFRFTLTYESKYIYSIKINNKLWIQQHIKRHIDLR